MMLTREQVGYVKRFLIDYPRDGSETLRLNIAKLFDTINELRADLEAVTKERDVSDAEYSKVFSLYSDTEARRQTCEAQLAQSQARVHELEMELRGRQADCIEHCEDWACAQLGWNAVKKRVQELEQERVGMKEEIVNLSADVLVLASHLHTREGVFCMDNGTPYETAVGPTYEMLQQRIQALEDAMKHVDRLLVKGDMFSVQKVIDAALIPTPAAGKVAQ